MFGVDKTRHVWHPIRKFFFFVLCPCLDATDSNVVVRHIHFLLGNLVHFFSQYLEEAHKNYIEMKTKLQETGTISSDRSFNAISNDLIPDIARYSTQPISNGHLYGLQYIKGYVILCDNNELFY